MVKTGWNNSFHHPFGNGKPMVMTGGWFMIDVPTWVEENCLMSQLFLLKKHKWSKFGCETHVFRFQLPSEKYQSLSGWWFGTFFISPYIGINIPIWLIFFRGVSWNQQPAVVLPVAQGWKPHRSLYAAAVVGPGGLRDSAPRHRTASGHHRSASPRHDGEDDTTVIFNGMYRQ